jgi:hypothetical protein
MRAFRFRFGSKEMTNFEREVAVECGSDCGSAWETSGRDAAEEVCSAHSVGSIGESYGGDVESRNWDRVPEVLAWSLLLTEFPPSRDFEILPLSSDTFSS